MAAAACAVNALHRHLSAWTITTKEPVFPVSQPVTTHSRREPSWNVVLMPARQDVWTWASNRVRAPAIATSVSNAMRKPGCVYSAGHAVTVIHPPSVMSIQPMWMILENHWPTTAGPVLPTASPKNAAPTAVAALAVSARQVLTAVLKVMKTAEISAPVTKTAIHQRAVLARNVAPMAARTDA
jgi:hypothetical protein